MAGDTLEATEWYGVGNGGIVKKRIYLSDSHPESWPSLWERQFGEPMPNHAREQVGLGPSPECQCQCPVHCPTDPHLDDYREPPF